MEESAAGKEQRSTNHWRGWACPWFLIRGQLRRRTELFPRRSPIHLRRSPNPEAKPRSSPCGEIARFRAGIRLEQSRGRQDVQRARRLRGQKVQSGRQPTRRWYPKSTPHLRIDLLRILFDKGINASGLLPQTFQLAHMLDPGLTVRLGIGRQLVFNRLGHKLAEGDAAFGRDGLGPAKDDIGNLQRSLHKAMLPYLWE